MTMVGSEFRADVLAMDSHIDVRALRFARAEAWIALGYAAAEIRPGMSEQEASTLAAAVLERQGVEGAWHSAVVRFGVGTLNTSGTTSRSARVLNPEDIYTVRMGPIWEDCLAGVADTFVLGDDPEMHACAEAVREVWHVLREKVAKGKIDGRAFHACAARQAETRGWRLKLVGCSEVARLSRARSGSGVDGDAPPRCGLTSWLMEIQIAHLSRPLGACYRDLIVADEQTESVPRRQASPGRALDQSRALR